MVLGDHGNAAAGNFASTRIQDHTYRHNVDHNVLDNPLLHPAPRATRRRGQGERDQLLALLPAPYHKESDNLAAVSQHITVRVEEEPDLRRLSSTHSWFWVAGLPLPPRALHRQLLLGREIFTTERMHLVQTTGKMFLKPIPRFLLVPDFWARYLTCRECGCCPDPNRATQAECKRPGLRQRALGFLFSYAALPLHESDFSSSKTNIYCRQR